MLRKKSALYLLITVLSIVISVGHIFSLNFDLPKSDYRENLAFAYNTLKYGTYSKQTFGKNPRPSNYREPVFPAVLMLGMLVHPGIDLYKQNANCIIKGYSKCVNIITYLKIVNTIFLILTALLAFYVIYNFTKSVFMSFIGFLMVSCSGSLGVYTNAFKSEIVTAFFVLLVSYLLSILVINKYSWLKALIYGFSLGVLVLSKAVFYYFVFISCTLLLVWWVINRVSFLTSLYRILIILFCSFLIILPWKIRNFLVLNDLSITSRSGIAISYRLAYNKIYPDEYIIFVISSFDRLLDRSKLKWIHNGIGYLFGFQIKGDIYSYNQIRDKYAKHISDRIKEMKKSGMKREQIDKILLAESKNKLSEELIANTALIIPFMIRASFPEIGYGFMTSKTNDENLGIKKFGIDATNIKISFIYINILYIFSFWGLLIYSLLRRKWKFIFFMLPVMYYVSIYVTFAYILNRYIVLIIPILVICTCITCLKLIFYCRNYN